MITIITKLDGGFMKTAIMNKAQKCCANYNVGKCLGAQFHIAKDGTVYTWADENFAKKDCQVEIGCDYFKQIVAPAIP